MSLKRTSNQLSIHGVYRVNVIHIYRIIYIEKEKETIVSETSNETSVLFPIYYYKKKKENNNEKRNSITVTKT